MKSTPKHLLSNDRFWINQYYLNLGGIKENTPFQIKKDPEFSLFFRFMDLIQFNGIFHLHFFSHQKSLLWSTKFPRYILVGKILWEIMYHHDQITIMI